MAPKKGKAAQDKEEEMIERITARINDCLDTKLEHFFQAAQAPRPAVTVPSPNVVRTRKRAREAEEEEPAPQPKRVAGNTKKKAQKEVPQSTSRGNIDLTPSPSRPSLNSRQATARPPASSVAPRDFNEMATGVGLANMAAPMNANNPWAAWSAGQPHSAQRFGFEFSPPTDTASAAYDDQVDSHVKQILASSVHNLAKGNVLSGVFPFKHVLRGPEKRQAQINSVTLSEHLWGMFRIICDPKVDPSIKPELMRHMEQIVEDGQEFDWELGVRRWSEEVFSRVAQNRLPLGWHSRNEIQMLRLTISQTAPLIVNNSSNVPAHAYVREAPRS